MPGGAESGFDSALHGKSNLRLHKNIILGGCQQQELWKRQDISCRHFGCSRASPPEGGLFSSLVCFNNILQPGRIQQ